MFALRFIKSHYNLIPKARKQIHQHSFLNKSKTDGLLDVFIHGEPLQFPFVWLRDNCQCEKCYHATAQSRILNWNKFDLNVTPTDVSKDSNSLHITWNDGHLSKYNFNWLKLRSFTKANQERYTETIYKPKKITWHGKDFNEIFYKQDYSNILNSDSALYDWLHKLSVYGVALIQNTPDSDTAIDAIVDRIGFSKKTHYGVKFLVQHVQNTSNVAYLSSNLQMHTDLPYYEYCPGTNLLHCLVQTISEGGDNLLSDCHYTANYMKKNHWDQYKLLTSVEVEWRDVGTEFGRDFFKLHRAPIICLDRHGEIERINFSIPQRGSYFPGPLELVKPWYEAHSNFWELSHKFATKFKVSPGEILAFNNIRMVHGRTAYQDSSNNVRKIVGTYIDWDEIYSKLRCLKVKLTNEEGIC